MTTDTAMPTLPVTPEEVETIRHQVIAYAVGSGDDMVELTDMFEVVADRSEFETLRARMNQWAPVHAALEDGVLPLEPFILERARITLAEIETMMEREGLYRGEPDPGSVESRDTIAALVSRLEAAGVAEEAAA
jgi:hypothetical protein